jgi:GT2 family glycosyltransferase
MAEKKVKVSIIILSFNTKELLKKCLESLNNLVAEIIVVDNGSSDGSVKMIESVISNQQSVASKKKEPNPNHQSPITICLIKNKRNLGYGAGNNQGMKIAKGEYFLLLNSDTIVKNNAPLKMAQFLDKHPEVGVLGCKLLNHDGSPQPSVGPFPNLGASFIMLFAEHWLGDLVRHSFPKTTEVDWVMGAALMVRREVFEKVGPMDEGLFMYMDEVEWCYRIKKAGYKIMFYPGAEIIHLFGGSSKTGRRDPILNIYRGLIYFYKKHYPAWQLPILKIMLKLKARLALILGRLSKNESVVQTYAEALKISRI